MIARLAGRVAAIEDGRCVLDVGGVGYLVQASTRTLAALPAPPEPAMLLIETQVREDAITLWGFAEPAERDWFRLLTAIQGVGARLALNLLSALAPAELAAAIAGADRARLTRAPGVGAKLAARLISELREKTLPAAAALGTVPPAARGGAAAEAVSALVNLGFRAPEAEAAVARSLARGGAGTRVETLIADSLRELAR